MTPDSPAQRPLDHLLPVSPDHLRVALAGNPNSGKTTIFNGLTGSRQKVANYPGVTVETKTGRARIDGRDVDVIDLPGTYSLTAHSTEEVIARDFVLSGQVDVVIDVVDASNLQRNLYLTAQLLELGVPVVVALNMYDVAEAHQVNVDVEMLSGLLGVPVVPTVGHRGKGLAEAMRQAVALAEDPERSVADQHPPDYGSEIEPHVRQLTARAAGQLADNRHARWYAVKLLEEDVHTRRRIRRIAPGLEQDLADDLQTVRKHLRGIYGDDPETLLSQRRTGFVAGACEEAVRQPAGHRYRASDRIDRILLHPQLGLPIFAGMMYLVFHLTFTVGEPPMHALEWLFGQLGQAVGSLWPAGSESLLRSLLVDGIIGGVGGVLVFLPNILLLFLAIAILEDTGYMARAAFLLDHHMHRLGLHGKSFIPMIIGFGCSVPAIMATRMLDTRRDRLTTMLVVPLMSCGARLPIYALIIPAFFPPAWRAPMLWIIYVVGVVLAIASARLLRRTLLKGQTAPFVMELPPYRMPTARGLGIHTWERGREYVKKAGTIILLASIVLWGMTTFPRKTDYDRDYDALTASVAAEHQAATAKLAGEIGLTGDANALAAALVGAPDLAELSASPGDLDNPRSRQLLELIRQVAVVRSDFRRRVERDHLSPSSEAYKLGEIKQENLLAAARAKHPRLLSTAEAYVDRIRPAYVHRQAELAAGRRAEEAAHSIAGRLGKGMEPVLEPMGFDWRIGTAMVGALAAKEVFVAQLGIVFSVGQEGTAADDLRTRLNTNYSPLTGLCIMLFTLIAAPCVATVAVMRREAGGWRWAALQFFGLTAMGWVVTTIVYQVGRLIV